MALSPSDHRQRALMWQWFGGVTNSIGCNGDLDTIDAIRLP